MRIFAIAALCDSGPQSLTALVPLLLVGSLSVTTCVRLYHSGYEDPTMLHLASSELWSGGRGILTELSLCYSLLLCSISAVHIAQS